MENNKDDCGEGMIDLLYRSLDESLSSRDEAALERFKSNKPVLAEEEKKIRAMRDQLFEYGRSLSFGAFFSQVVMRVINVSEPVVVRYYEWFNSIVAAFKPVAAILVIIIFVLLCFTFYKPRTINGDFITNTIITIEEANTFVLEEML